MSIAEQVAEGRLGAASFKSVADMWHHRIESTPESPAMIERRDGAWVSMTWREVGSRVRHVADALLALGLGAEERCAIIAETRVDWVIADVGILCAGGATTTLYPATPNEECQFILQDCGAIVVFCDTDEQVAKLRLLRDRIPSVRRVVTFRGSPGTDGWVQTLRQFEEEGRAFALACPGLYDVTRNAITPDRLATLMYTSGTTGRPKGVMLTHDAWVYEAEAIDALGIMSPADKQFLVLPLSHVFAKVLEVLFIRLGVLTVVDGDTDALITNLAETQPTWMGAVPRTFEKAYARIAARAKEGGRLQQGLFRWALETGAEVSRKRQKREEPGGLLKLRAAMADRLVLSDVKARFGGRIRFFISGGAPLSKEIAEFFHSCDLLILEGYGLTESCAATCVNTPDDFRFGTVGKPLPGTRVQIAPDGEILIRGRGVLKGYYTLPEDTAEALTPDGWLRTGDIGIVHESGHVEITDRKKELIITAGGKNIAPAHFQNLLKSRCPYVSEVLMHGDKRPYCVALVSINGEATGRWARVQKLSFTDYEDLARNVEVHRLIMGVVQEVNKELPPFEAVRKVALLPEDLTQENGALTPSLKVKRKVVEQRYSALLDRLYDEA
jgi:long-chain acyl-CoA synthetase